MVPWHESLSAFIVGSTLLIGGMYTYDLFASTPCCPKHLECKSCGHMVLSASPSTVQSRGAQGNPKRTESYPGIFETSHGHPDQPTTVRRFSEGAQEYPGSLDPLLPLPFFSQYSNLICCQHCQFVDYHFIRPFDEMYTTVILVPPTTQPLQKISSLTATSST